MGSHADSKTIGRSADLTALSVVLFNQSQKEVAVDCFFKKVCQILHPSAQGLTASVGAILPDAEANSALSGLIEREDEERLRGYSLSGDYLCLFAYIRCTNGLLCRWN